MRSNYGEEENKSVNFMIRMHCTISDFIVSLGSFLIHLHGLEIQTEVKKDVFAMVVWDIFSVTSQSLQGVVDNCLFSFNTKCHKMVTCIFQKAAMVHYFNCPSYDCDL